MALTATANSLIEDDIKLLLRHPIVQKASMNRPNLYLNVEELPVYALRKSDHSVHRWAS